MNELNELILESYSDLIDSRLEVLLEGREKPVQELTDAMRYSTMIGGKRIRPVLVLEFCRVCGGDPEQALAFACALEMIHTSSLIHDDLPCMDNDDLRRGQPSCHKKFGEPAALLAGDALEAFAFETAASADLRPKRIVEAVRLLAQATGPYGMLGGQILDTETETLPAVGHDYQVTTHVDPTYEDNGYEILVCTRCGDEKTEVLSVCPHEFDIAEDPPTCEEPGRRTFTCRLCGYVKIEEIPPLGHQYETQMEVDPTCVEDGFYRGKCTVCGAVTSERIPALGHHLVPDPDGGGSVCTICGAKVRDKTAKEVPAFQNPLVIVILAVVAAQLIAVVTILVRSRMEAKKKRQYH